MPDATASQEPNFRNVVSMWCESRTLSQKREGYCWPTPQYRNWCAQHAFFEGKKAEETATRKSTSRTLKEVGQQSREGLRDMTKGLRIPSVRRLSLLLGA